MISKMSYKKKNFFTILIRKKDLTMILSNSKENDKETSDNSKISVPIILQDDGCVGNSSMENIEFDLDIKIWIKTH